MAGLRARLCEACRDECRGQDQREERSGRAPSNERERPGPQPNKESPAGGEKEKPTVVVTDAQLLRVFSDERMTKLMTTGGPTSLCYQL